MMSHSGVRYQRADRLMFKAAVRKDSEWVEIVKAFHMQTCTTSILEMLQCCHIVLC